MTNVRDVTGVLLVGGASRRFGSPKALAEFGGSSLAERAWNLVGEAFATRLAIGKTADALALPFPLLNDGTEVRAPIAGVVAGLRAAQTDVCVFLPVDVPLMTVEALRELAARCRDAAVPQTGPLPGAYRRSALPILARRLKAGALALRDALSELDVDVVELNAKLLVNVNVPEDLERLA